ncbi:MAG: hypothetical protein ACLPX5_05090 [Dissulfurispiraceae bacterium]
MAKHGRLIEIGSSLSGTDCVFQAQTANDSSINRRGEMFIYRGTQGVGRGTYWEPDTGKKIVLTDNGFLPGDRNEWYFKLPDSYFLIPIFLLGLGLSMAFPYGLGVLVFFCLVALAGAFYAAGSASVRLLREMLGRNATFGYAPTASYMAGKKMKKRNKKESSEKKDENS